MDIFDPKQLALLQIEPQENASLQTLLKNKNLPLLQLLSIKNIQPKIRLNMPYFIKHCQKNQDFCYNLIDIGIKCPMHQGSNDNMKQACYIAADVLTCDQDIIADLLILPDKNKPKKNQSENQSQEFQQIEQNIETQVDDSAGPQQVDKLEQSLTEEQKFDKKYKFLTRILGYVCKQQSQNLDQNCINYMIKSLNCLVRKKAQQFFEYLNKKEQLFNRLIQINYFSSINQFLIKILSDDEQQGEMSQKIKKHIIEGVLKRLISSVNQQQFIQRLEFLQQLFQTNKYASEDDRTKLQKSSDIFVSKQTIQYFYEHLMNAFSATQLYNSISYLHSIIRRMNVDQEVDPYSYSNQPKQQTMVFQVDVLFKEYTKIITQGYQNLNNLKYPQSYKQKLLQTKFYQMLVLLTKNSRFNNCYTDIKKLQNSSTLKGNNIIFSNRQQKINIVKQLLKQFTNQAKNGLNRIFIIALIQKVLQVQIFDSKNHPDKSVQNLQTQKKQSLDQKKQQNLQTKQQNDKQDSADKTNDNKEQPQGEDKKKKINKIKAGLKLNIKKFSLDGNQSTQKKPKVQLQTNAQQKTDHSTKCEQSLTKDQVLNIIKFLSVQLKNHIELSVPQIKKKEKNNQTEIGALINKIVMILCNSIWWQQFGPNMIISQRQRFVTQLQQIIPCFNFQQICKNYSITLATPKHPNLGAKQKSNPQLTFTNQFFKIYSTKKQKVQQKPKQKNMRSLQLSDSDFKSDQQQIHAVKCSLEDFKKLTGFKFQAKTSQTVEKQPEISQKKVQQQTPQPISQIQPQTQQKKDKKQLQTTKQAAKQNEKQNKAIKKEAQTNKNNINNPNTSKNTIKQQKIPIEFYIRHHLILV